MVGLVHNHHVEVTDLRKKRGPNFLAAGRLHRDDRTKLVSPWIMTEALEVLLEGWLGQDVEVLVKLPVQLLAPFVSEPGRADDQYLVK